MGQSKTPTEQLLGMLDTYWPRCQTENCKARVCTWASNVRCFPCEEFVVGHEEMISRYNLTHELPWQSDVEDNPMTRTYNDLLPYLHGKELHD